MFHIDMYCGIIDYIRKEYKKVHCDVLPVELVGVGEVDV